MRKNIRAIRAVVEDIEKRLLFSSLNIVTHHEDAVNDGANNLETVLNPANVNATDFGKQFTNTVDGGDVIASPLYMQNVIITSGSSPGVHSVVFVATEADGLYALDANTGSTLWHDNFTNIADPTNLTPTTGVTTIQITDINNNPDVGTQLGILATPAIDTTTNVMYVLTNTKEIRADGKHFVQRLWAVSINSGTPVLTPAVIGDTLAPSGLTTTGPYTYVSGPIVNGSGNNDPYNTGGTLVPPAYPDTDGWTSAPGGATGYVIAFNAIEQMERPALTLMGGSVYTAFASHGDDGPYYGWVLGYSESSLSLDAAFVTTPTFESSSVVGSSQPFWNLGGIWMSGSNLATDGTNLFVITGNGAFNGNASNFDANGFPIDHDYGDTVLKLTPDSSTVATQNGNGWGLKVSDYFTPSNQLELNDKDLDLGSGGVTLLPNTLLDAAGNPMLAFGGKESRVYLLDQKNLGKFNYNYPGGSTTVDPSTYDHVVAEYANNGLNNGGKQVYSSPAYVQGNLYFGIANSPALEINVAIWETGTFTPIHSTLSFGYPGETFDVSTNNGVSAVLWAENPGGSDLVAFNPSNFTTAIYDSNTNSADALNGTIHFHDPTEAEGMVYAGSRGGGLGGYGLDLSYLLSNSTFFGAPTGLAATEVSATDVHLNWVSHSSLATELQVQRSVNGGAWTTLQYLSGTATSFDDTTIQVDTSYQYRVVGISGTNVTAPSNTVTFALPLVLTGPSFYLRLDPNGTSVDVWTNSTPGGGTFQSLALSQISSVLFTGTGSSSNFTVDFTAGNPLPSGGLSFNGSGVSTLTLIGDGGNDAVTVNAGNINFTGAFGTAPITYADATTINFNGGSGSNVLTQTAAPGGGAGVLFNNTNAADTINISAGSMNIPIPTGAVTPVGQLGTLLLGNGAQAVVSLPAGTAGHGLLELNSFSLAGTTGNWLSRFDLAGNDLLLHTASLNTLGTQIAQPLANGWSGNGLTSSAAASDGTHLTALGAIANNNSGQSLYGSGTTLGLFDGISPAQSDFLVESTYFGDANLDTAVDGSDYSRIDSAVGTGASGWFNGDFNYDGVINGSDYTLIDNAFNRQGLSVSTALAVTTNIQTVVVGVNSGNISVQLRNALGGVVNAPAGGTLLNLSTTSSSGSFFSGSSPITSILIPAGSSTASFAYEDTTIGTPVLTASAAGLKSVSQSINVTATTTATQLAITTAPLIQAVGTVSGSMTVLLENASGVAVNAATGGVTVSLSTSSSVGTFQNSGGTNVTSVSIPAGSSSVSFKYTDNAAGIATITATASGLTSSIQQETITAAVSSIAFTSPAHTMIVGASPANLTIQLDDQVGNPIAAGAAGVVINFQTNSSAGTFYNSTNTPVTSVTVPAGSTSVTVAYRDPQLGQPNITASSTGLASISQRQSVIGLPTGTVAYYGFNSSSGFLSDASGTGNTLAVGGGTVAYTNAGLLPGFTGAASFSNSGYLTTSTGSFPVSVPTGNSSYTLSAWIDIASPNNKNGIVGWGNWGTGDQVNGFRTTNADSGASNGAGLDNYWWNDDYVQPTGVSLVKNWEYVTATYNGSYRSIYLNGQLVGTYTSTNQNNAQAINFRIGDTNNTEYFGGTIADLLIANNAFSSSQINELYDGISNPPVNLNFTNSSLSMIQGASPATLTIQLQDANGNPVAADSGSVTVNLSTTSTGGAFYNSSNGLISSIIVPQGASSVTVAYHDSKTGSPTLTASATGLSPTSQLESVSALPSSVVAYYGFNTSSSFLNDGSGSGNTLKVAAGTVSFTTGGLLPGFTGAASFSNSGYLTTASGNFPANVPVGNSAYTIAAWIDINNTGKNGLVSWGNSGTTDQVNAFRTTSGDTGASDGAGLDNFWFNDDFIQSTMNLVNTWAYVALTYDGTMRSMYFDGVLIGTYHSANSAAAAALSFRVGSASGAEYFAGSMADLLIANQALNTSQIDQFYNGT